MLTIRLQRRGRKNDPSFRIIVTDKRESTTSTRFNDIVGTYQPKAGKFEIDAEKVKSPAKMLSIKATTEAGIIATAREGLSSKSVFSIHFLMLVCLFKIIVLC